jgi:hypothetical protein
VFPSSNRRDACDRAFAAAARSTPTPRAPRRIVFTTLGDQGDFANPEFRVISVQMIAWAIGEEAQHARAATKALTNGK